MRQYIKYEDTHTFIATRAGIFDQYGLVIVISKTMIEGRKGKEYKGEEAIDNETAIQTSQWKKETMEKRERETSSLRVPAP